MTSVKLFGHHYPLPTVANDRFCRLQQRVNQQYKRLQGQSSPPSPRWRLPMRAASSQSPEARFAELSRLVSNYQQLVDELQRSQLAYQRFFANLAAGVQSALGEKKAELLELEYERCRSQQAAEGQQDALLHALAIEDEELLLQGVRLLGQAALLLLKKIALCQESLARLAEDQDLQRQVLLALIEHLDGHRQAYERRKRIDKIIREVAEMAEVALEFEAYMRQQLGPLQELLDHVVKIDDTLHHAVTDIETITRQMLKQGPVLAAETSDPQLTPFDTQLLEFLTLGQLKKERLAEMWKPLQPEAASDFNLELSLVSDGATTNPVSDALDNIEQLVDLHLAPLLSTAQHVIPARLPPPARLPIKSRHPVMSKLKPALFHPLAKAATQLSWTVSRSTNRLNLEFVLIPSGTFHMGSTVFDDEQPVHEVRISRPFYLGKYLVTQAQWIEVMGTAWRQSTDAPRHPIENVSWEEVQVFIQKLNDIEGHQTYRLPTEAEWEYAARANAETSYYFGDDRHQLRNYAWYEDNSAGHPHAVGRLKPNSWGLYDMHGNVWEWVQDWYAPAAYRAHTAQDPQGLPTGVYRVVRGGGWNCSSGDCRLASRNIERPHGHHPALGFRVLRQL